MRAHRSALRPLTHALLAFALAVSVAGPAAAVAAFDGEVTSLLTITSVDGGAVFPSGLSIEGSVAIFDEFAFATGADTASASEVLEVISGGASGCCGPSPLTALGDGLHQEAAIDGMAADGTALAFLFTDGLIEATNTTGSAVTLGLLLDWSFAVSASVDDPIGEDAFVDVFLTITVDGTPVFDLADESSEATFADALFGPAMSSDADTFAFDVVVPDGTTVEIATFLDADGTAVAPEPAGLLSALLGGGLALFARRRG